MSGKVIALTAALAATSLLLSACGSDSSKSKGTSGAGGSSAAAGASKTVAAKLILGGPAEFKTRSDGIPGLKKNYGVSFQSYKVLDTGGPVTVTSLKNGQVDAADLFTTDPAIKANNFVVLTDPKSNFGAQNVVPLINQAKATPGVKQVLNFISAKLTTQDLINLRTEVEVNKQDPATAATTFLKGLGQQPPATLNAGVKLTVGSANFPENVVLADIYAIALQATGAKVTTKLNIGSREKYLPAVKDGEIDLFPEYTGVLLQFLDKTATATSSQAVYAALQKTVAGLTGNKSKLTVLDQAPAEDADAIVVTKQTADKYGLTSIADLAKPAS